MFNSVVHSPMEKMTGALSSTGMFQKAILMAMVQSSRLMQQDTLWARVKGLRHGGSTMDSQMCSSLKPVDVLLWKMFLVGKNEMLSSLHKRTSVNIVPIAKYGYYFVTTSL